MAKDLFGNPRQYPKPRPATFAEICEAIEARVDKIVLILDEKENIGRINFIAHSLADHLHLIEKEVAARAHRGCCPKKLSRVYDGIRGLWRSYDELVGYRINRWRTWKTKDFLDSRILFTDCRTL